MITSAAISLLALCLSLSIKFSNTPVKLLNEDPLSLFTVQYDLILLSFSLLLGSYFAKKSAGVEPRDVKSKNPLLIPMAVAFCAIILCFMLENITKTDWAFVKAWPFAFKVLIPVLLGAFTVGFTVLFVQRQES